MVGTHKIDAKLMHTGLQMITWLCLQKVYIFRNFEIMTVSTEKNYFFLP